jgi:hypothetical protein
MAADAVEMKDALVRIAEQQQKALKMIRENGFVFLDIGNEPGNWQHLAFSLYTDICEIDVWARSGLGLSVGDPYWRGASLTRCLSRDAQHRLPRLPRSPL